MKTKRAASIHLRGAMEKNRDRKMSPESQSWDALLFCQACDKILAALEETSRCPGGDKSLPCPLHWAAIGLCSPGELGSDFRGHISTPREKRQEETAPNLFFENSSSLLRVAIAPTGIYLSGKTELSKRNGAILVPWDLFTEWKGWCNL